MVNSCVFAGCSPGSVEELKAVKMELCECWCDTSSLRTENIV